MIGLPAPAGCGNAKRAAIRDSIITRTPDRPIAYDPTAGVHIDYGSPALVLGSLRHEGRVRKPKSRLRKEKADTPMGWVKSDPVSLDTVWTTMTAAKEAGHEGQGAKAHHDSWQ
jgi:hypothetical protein